MEKFIPILFIVSAFAISVTKTAAITPVEVMCGSCQNSQWGLYTEVYFYCAGCGTTPTPSGMAIKEYRYLGNVVSWIYIDAAAAYFACPIHC
jgi:hypothetical protein